MEVIFLMLNTISKMEHWKDALAFLLSLLLVSGAIKKNCKLCAMEADSEKAKNWAIFWNIFNQVLSKHTKEIQQAGV